MSKKMYFVFAVLIIASMVLPSCGKKKPDCSKPDVICVGLVTDVGKVDDKSFNQSSWEGITAAQKEGLVQEAQYIETTDSKDYDKNIATFADEKYDVIVTSGFNLGTATMAAAKKYPDVKFIAVDQSKWVFTPAGENTPANFVGLVFPEDQAGFLVGALAAMMSKSHKIGAVCGIDSIPPVWRFGEGYKAGAAYIDGQKGLTTEVSVVYHNDVGMDKTFVDPEWGAATADSMIDKGVDVIFGAGGKTGNGAVEEGAKRGVYVIGVDTDQYFALPSAASKMLSSAYKLITPGVHDILQKTKDGKFPGGDDYLGPAGFAPYHELDSAVPADVKTTMDSLFKALQDGSLKTNVAPAKP